jgi:curved DNA-binding protein CbpA
MLMAPDHYQVLGVARAASREDITRAWRLRARAEHPDRRPADAGDAAARRFRCVAEAYQVLSDPDRRAAYDSTLSPASARTRTRPAPFLLVNPPLRAGPVKIEDWPPATGRGDERDAWRPAGMHVSLVLDFLAWERGRPW